MANLQVKTRMYKVGELGDCFLLQFKEDNVESNVLIDCGSFRNSEKSIRRMNEISENIAKELKGKPLDVVVGTHQHNDHLSGFTHASSTWKKIGARESWLSWLDNPDDIQAKNVSDQQKNLTVKLELISTKLKSIENTSFTDTKTSERINDILGFYLGATDKKDPVIPAMGLEVIKAMSDKTRYVEPGQVLDLPGLNDGSVKVYILGPPRNEKQLYDIHASKSESYDHKLTLANTMADNYLKGLSNFEKSSGRSIDESYFPFALKYHCSSKSSLFKKSSYHAETNDWRKVDSDWLEQAERLSLYLDTYTNNTSLVLAFELVKSGKILLFVGDAQTGNWLSWNDIKWEEADKGVHVNKLLAKTVLYKVGHHCSHNATLVAGLEAMTHPELVAMIPVDKSDPNITKKNGWKMPASNLHQRLKEKTSNRLIRMDGFDPDCDPKIPQVKSAWGKLEVPTEHELYFQYTIKG